MAGADVGTVGGSADDLAALLYDRLHALAERQMRGERSGHTLQPTALVNEVYLRMVGRSREVAGWLHFMRLAARVMREVLTDHARARATEKRGGGWKRRDLDGLALASGDGSTLIDALALDEALTCLERLNPRHARIVEIRFYCGAKNQEIAEVLACSVSTVEKDWKAARAWLHDRLSMETR